VATPRRPSLASRSGPIPSAEEIAVVGFKAGEGSIEHFPARHDDNIESRCDLIPPEDLSRQTLGAVAIDRRSHLARCRDAEPGAGATVRYDEQHHQPAVEFDARLVGPFELRSVPDANRPRQTLVGATAGH